jgi:hypothetical protein
MNQIIPVDGFEFHVDQNQEPRITSELLASKLGYDNRYGLTHGGGSAYSEAWVKIYRELRLRTSFSAVVRAKNSKKGALDVVEEAGLLPQLYAIAREVLRD